jgi:signal peptidase I
MMFWRAKKEKQKKKSPLREWGSAILWAVTLALVIRAGVVQANIIPSGSMQPTLLIGDNLLVNRLAYDLKVPFVDYTVSPLSDPQRGDIVVFANPEGQGPDLIKRIIGLPGETLEVLGKTVYINGQTLAHDWGHFSNGPSYPRGQFGPVLVPRDHYFVMGDNRDNSYDSRFWNQERGGFVPRQDIRGKAMVVHWSYQDHLWNLRWRRFGTILR